MLVSKVVYFWLPILGFNLRLESHALLLNTEKCMCRLLREHGP